MALAHNALASRNTLVPRPVMLRPQPSINSQLAPPFGHFSIRSTGLAKKIKIRGASPRYLSPLANSVRGRRIPQRICEIQNDGGFPVVLFTSDGADINGNFQPVFAAAEEDAADGGHVGVIAAPGNRNMTVADQTIVGGVKINPT